MEIFVFDQNISKKYWKSLETNLSKKKTSTAEVHEKYLCVAKRGSHSFRQNPE